MMGMLRLVKDGKIVFYELLTLVEHESSLLLPLKHFNADLTGWEEKADTVKFRLLKIAADAAHFAAMTFHRLSDEAVEVFLAIRNRADGSIREERFLMQRVREQKAVASAARLVLRGYARVSARNHARGSIGGGLGDALRAIITSGDGLGCGYNRFRFCGLRRRARIGRRRGYTRLRGLLIVERNRCAVGTRVVRRRSLLSEIRCVCHDITSSQTRRPPWAVYCASG